MAHIHSVYDSDTHFSINPITRQFKNEGSAKAKVSQFDHNSERFTFEIPRYIADGHDMSLCNSVQVHFLNLNPQTKEKRDGFYVVDDLQISPEDDNTVICSWLIAKSATQLEGKLNFLIRFSCVADDGTIEFVWNTAIYTDIAVSSGIYNGDADDEEYIDILKQWEIGFNNRLDAVVSYDAQEVTDEQRQQARENIGAASKEDLEGLNFMPPEGDPEAEVRFDVAHAQMMTAPEFVIADPEKSTESILLTKEGAEEDEEPRKAVMLTDLLGNPVILSNVANPEVGTDAANMSWVNKEVTEQSKYILGIMEDKRIKVSGAEVGQLLKVSAVDEDGVPTAWKSANNSLPPWKHLRTVTIPEDITTDMSGVIFYESSDGTGINFGFDTDKDGNSFAVNELFIYCEARNSAPGTGTMTAVLYPLGSANSTGYHYITGMNIGCAEASTHQTIMCAKCHIIGAAGGYIFGWGVSGQSITPQSATRQFGVNIPVPFRSVRLLPTYNATCGFLPGSKFSFYGR